MQLMCAVQRPKAQLYILFALINVLLLMNISGLIPYSYAFTSQLFVTMMLSLVLNSYVILRAVSRQGLSFLCNFLPKDIPLPIVPLLIVIETVSYALKILTLAIRLFANITAGHILLAIIAGFAVMLLTTGDIALLALSSALGALICIL